MRVPLPDRLMLTADLNAFRENYWHTCRILDAIRIVITLTLILTLKPDPHPNPNHNPNPTKPY